MSNPNASATNDDYTDSVESLPDDMQRNLSRLSDINVKQRDNLRDVNHFCDLGKALVISGEPNENRCAQALAWMHQCLIKAQELSSEKTKILHQINDLSKNKTTQQESDLNLVIKEEEQQSGEQHLKTAWKIPGESATGASTSSNCFGTVPTGGSGTGRTTAGKSCKEKKGRGKQALNRRRESPLPDPIDPNKQHHCSGNRVSFGKMVLCDNKLCPIGWFHLSCVSLGAKPKGQWYCPQCRADRPTVMKPKQQFLKELDRFNKK